MKLWHWFLRWPRLVRWCHHMKYIYLLEFHRGVTITRSIGLWSVPLWFFPVSIECDCGKIFWIDKKFEKARVHMSLSIDTLD